MRASTNGPAIMRSQTSIAYSSVSPTQNLRGRLSFFLRNHGRAVIATAAFLGFVLVLSSDYVQDPIVGNSLRMRRHPKNWGGAVRRGYFDVAKSKLDANTFRWAAVTDKDQLSLMSDSKKGKPKFESILLPGTITRDPATNKYSIEFEDTRSLVSKHNEEGRGMELSELTIYENRLLSFDDRTGTVFEILNKNGGKDSYVVPRFVITEGEGETDKGMKWEWSTVKDGNLYMGSMGKEYTNADGSIANTNNLWIAVINSRGELTRIDWSEKFNFVRAALGASSPGYMITEAVLWSSTLKKWVFLPRRISDEAYDENKDERKGSDKLVLVDEHFTDAQVVTIKMKKVDPLHGFSTVAFVPGTNDHHAIAIRSVEEDCVGGEESVCKQRSYFIVFDVLTGEVLMDEVHLDMDDKFEGIEFVDIYTPETTSKNR
eukprot:CAMPEP_0198291746 /NCGR_PEP_ID=MMETSP1449-20131203/9172_1 /TAXON_ID=420275 /ORGANISM="Attheya septentrionalis, Strain CCMP2084" /LENGTH=429 /DNA_ID=CAMNT_0043990427 /DNA_START=313 /DNA_END=1602 /DNA_ORIENTATION=+